MSSDLGPMTLGELLDRTFSLYRRNFLLFVGIVALPHLILLAFQLSSVVLRLGRSATLAAAGVIWTLATVIVQLGAVAASQGATVIAVSRVHLDRPVSIAQSFAGIKGRILYFALIMIGTWIGIGLVVFVPVLIGIGLNIGAWSVLFIIPGIIAGVILALMWALTIPVAVLEDTGLRDSVSRSAALTKGFRWRVFIVYLIFLVITYMVLMVWQIPIIAIMAAAARTSKVVPQNMLWAQIALPIGTFISQCLVAPLMTIGFSLLYYDLRIRKEAFDLQLMMSSLDSDTTSGEAAGATV
jgi:MFS family permease